MLQVEYIVNKIFNSRTYILSNNSDEVWLVDCGDVDKVMERIGEKIVAGALLTHTHSDHIYGLPVLLEKFPEVKIVTNEYGKKALKDPKRNLSKYNSEYPDVIVEVEENIEIVSEGDIIEGLKVIETPGHDPSCLCYLNDKFIFTGDSYIPGIKMVTSFPHSNKVQALESERRIRNIGNVIIYPGHNMA